MRVVVVIPARYASSRFPGKVVFPISGKPMIQRVWERARLVKGVDDVVVATDDKKVAEVVTGFGGHVVMTSPDCKSGTERCAEASEKIASDIILNVQGDEPLINPESLRLVLNPLLDDDEEKLAMSTLKHPVQLHDDYINPNIVKVVCDEMDNAIYFSRSPLPFYRDKHDSIEKWKRDGQPPEDLKPAPMKHIGVYAYRTKFLQALVRLPRTDLENACMLEQLRVLAWGFKIRVVHTPHESIGVDVPGDAKRVESLIESE